MTFELVGNYGRSTTEGRERVLVQQNFENALNAVRDAGGNIVCAPGQPNSPLGRSARPARRSIPSDNRSARPPATT
jgi:hypothetical protein